MGIITSSPSPSSILPLPRGGGGYKRYLLKKRKEIYSEHLPPSLWEGGSKRGDGDYYFFPLPLSFPLPNGRKDILSTNFSLHKGENILSLTPPFVRGKTEGGMSLLFS